MRFKRDIYYKKSVDELTAEQKNMTAKDCYDYIRTSQGANVINFFTAAKDTNKNGKIDAEEQAQADEDYSIEDALKIMTVRYAQLMNTYSKYEPITLSSNVSQRTVAAIKENSADMPGVEVSTELKRVYKDSKYFSHIIGYTGMISSETLENLKAEDPNTPYTSTDQIGKTGIEQEYEEQLRGSKGSQKLIIDSSSRVVETTKEKDAVAGTDIYLSIDSDLQKAVYKLAEKEIAGILTSKLVNGKSHGTKGHKASGILVPIYDVYDAILQNSIVDVTHFKDDKATTLEKNVYNKFLSSKKSAVNAVKSHLTYNDKTAGKDLSKSVNSYMTYIMSMLRTNGIFNSNFKTTDAMYSKFINDKISLSEFLVYAIENNYINLNEIDIGSDYYSSEEVFQKICRYIYTELNDDAKFDKKVYHVMVDKGTISGREICLLLFDQGVLKKNQTTYTKIQTGMISPYSFLKSKIRSLAISPGELGLTPCEHRLLLHL